MMRVLHVAEYAKGGVATYLHTLFQDSNPALEQYLLVADHHSDASWELPAGRVHLYPYVRGLASVPHAMLAVRRAVRALRPDVCYFHSSWAGVYGRMALVGLSPRPRVLYNAHGWAFLRDTAAWKQEVYAWIERMLARGTDAIIDVSDDEQRAALAHGLPAAKLHRIYNGIPDEGKEPDLAVQPKRLEAGGRAVDFPPEALKLLFIGRWDPQKGLDVLLETFLQTQREDVRLYVLGAGVVDQESRAAARLNALFARAQQDPRIVFVGWVAHEALADWYGACDAVIMPSRWEAFGLVAAEAMQHGRPVLASDRGALPEVVEDGKTGRIFSLEGNSLATLLASVTRDELHAMRTAAREAYRARFTADGLWRAITMLYTTVMSTRGGAEL